MSPSAKITLATACGVCAWGWHCENSMISSWRQGPKSRADWTGIVSRLDARTKLMAESFANEFLPARDGVKKPTVNHPCTFGGYTWSCVTQPDSQKTAQLGCNCARLIGSTALIRLSMIDWAVKVTGPFCTLIMCQFISRWGTDQYAPWVIAGWHLLWIDAG